MRGPSEDINRSGGTRKGLHRVRPMNNNERGRTLDAIEHLDNSGDNQDSKVASNRNYRKARGRRARRRRSRRH